MDFNIACALHFASRCEGYLFNDAYFEDPQFQEDFEKIMGVFDHKKSSDRAEVVKSGN